MTEPASRTLPSGTITFLFTDIEGSTSLARSLGERWVELVGEHDRRVRGAIERAGGVVVRTEGDSFFAVFTTAASAVGAAADVQRVVAAPWPDGWSVRVRMGLHTGPGVVVGGDYVGYEVHRAARIAAAGHGGQVLLSDATHVLVEDDLPSGLGVRDLGTFRLKDVGPQRLHQLVIEGLESEFPKPRSLDPETNLPAQLAAFVGRGAELERIGHLLGTTRLLTLTGPGGTGKTRLAIEAARRLADRFDGVWFVDLAPVRDPASVVAAIAASIGAREDARRSPFDALRDRLSDRDVLLVLDNFEQVLEASEALVELLASLPRLVAMVTSRAPLRVRGEQEMPVTPLAVPDPDRLPGLEELSRSDAVALFVLRAAAIDPAFALTDEVAPVVAAICARLDGLPLAIELAASRLRVLSPRVALERLERRLPELAARGRDLPERHRTLRSAIAWSEELLDPGLRTLFARLCVLRGDWSLDAAGAIGGGDLGLDPLDALETLRDHSLVQRSADEDGGPWFSMLQTIREYGQERLAEAGEETAVRDRHAAYFLALAERAEPELTGPRALEWRRRLGRDQPNLTAAIEWSVERGDPDTGMRIGAALWRFWQVRGTLREGRRLMAEVLSLPRSESRTQVRARALLAAGSLAYWAGDHGETRRSFDEALAISRELGDEVGIAHALYNLAFAYGAEGDFATGWDLLRDALGRFEALGDDLMAAHVKIGLGMAGLRRGDTDDAAEITREALRTFEAADQVQWVSLANGVLAQIAFAQGDEGRTLTHTKRALDATERLGDPLGTAVQFNVVGGILARRGLYDQALRLAGAARRINDEAGGEAPRALIESEDPVEVAAATLTAEQIHALLEEGAQLSLEQARELARSELEALSAT